MEKVERLKRELAYEGTILKVYKDYVRTPDGHEAVWDFIHHDGAAAVVPVMDDGRLLLVRQYRNALDRFTLELPAGKLDAPGEPGIECAARELEEETGYRSDDLTLLIKVNTTIAFCNEWVEIYLARNLKPSHQHLDEGEDIEIEAWTVEDLLALIREQKITDAKTMAGIMAYRTFCAETAGE